MFSLHVSPCRLLYWFSRPLSARTHYRSTSAHIECYLAIKQDGFFLIDLLTLIGYTVYSTCLYDVQSTSNVCNFYNMLSLIFYVCIQFYHTLICQNFFLPFLFTSFSAPLPLSALYHYRDSLSSANLMKFR